MILENGYQKLSYLLGKSNLMPMASKIIQNTVSTASKLPFKTMAMPLLPMSLLYYDKVMAVTKVDRLFPQAVQDISHTWKQKAPDVRKALYDLTKTSIENIDKPIHQITTLTRTKPEIMLPVFAVATTALASYMFPQVKALNVVFNAMDYGLKRLMPISMSMALSSVLVPAYLDFERRLMTIEQGNRR